MARELEHAASVVCRSAGRCQVKFRDNPHEPEHAARTSTIKLLEPGQNNGMDVNAYHPSPTKHPKHLTA